VTARGATARIGGVEISNAEKVWWPDDGITKGDVARFYDGVSPLILSWLRDRPMTAERCPDGMRGQCFFQKNFSEGLPAGLRTAPIAAETAGRIVRYARVGADVAHAGEPRMHRHARHELPDRSLDQPDWLAFDLDPGSGRFADAARAGRALRELIDERGLRSFPKTSGARGLHVLVPLRRGATQDAVRAFAMEIGRTLAERTPGLVTVEMSKRKRRGRVFADALRNAFGQTIVAPYCVRRRPKAPVSTPLDWDEVDTKLDPARYTIRTIERRLAGPDPWADFWTNRQRLPEPRKTWTQQRAA
jgi:bifunctional non-homologous end joining protein LigD